MHQSSPAKANGDFEIPSVTNKLKESSCDGGPLGSEGRYHQVETNTTVAMTTKKGHQKAKTNENHHMYILKHWKDRKITIK